MLLLSLSFCLISFFSFYSFTFYLLFLLFYFLTNMSMFSSYTLYLSGLSFDELSLFMLYITLFVIFISFLSYVSVFSVTSAVYLALVSLVVFCLLFFMSLHSLLIYFCYEASLLPILFIIINWGSYPERSVSSFMLFIYTALFTFPFIVVVFYLNSSAITFSLYSLIFSSSVPLLSSFVSLLIFLTFSVKLPLYGVHYWLPIAHVEAPTFGSMILAGILLKLGGVGLARFGFVVDNSYVSSVFLSYLIVFLVYASVVCMYQSDFNRLIAYSSVSHMIVIPILFLADNVLSSKSILFAMFYHGLSSPLLFLAVGSIYYIYSTRQLVLARGLGLISPLFTFLLILAFFFTLSAPPFPSFVSEAFFVLSSYALSTYFMYSFLLFIFVSLVYNLNWLVTVLFSNVSSSLSYSYSVLSFPVFFIFFVSFLLSFSSLLFFFIA